MCLLPLFLFNRGKKSQLAHLSIKAHKLSVTRHTPPQERGSIINGQVLRQTADGTPPLDSSFGRQWPHAPSTPHLTCQSSESTLNLPGVTSITKPLERTISPFKREIYEITSTKFNSFSANFINTYRITVKMGVLVPRREHFPL